MQNQQHQDDCRVFVSNIEFSTTEQELEALFSASGEVKVCEIMRKQYTGDSRGFGFISFADSKSAKIAIADYDGYLFKGRNLIVRHAVQKVPYEKHTREREFSEASSREALNQAANAVLLYVPGQEPHVQGYLFIPGYNPPPPGYMYAPIPGHRYVPPYSPAPNHAPSRTSHSKWYDENSSCEVIRRR